MRHIRQIPRSIVAAALRTALMEAGEIERPDAAISIEGKTDICSPGAAHTRELSENRNTEHKLDEARNDITELHVQVLRYSEICDSARCPSD